MSGLAAGIDGFASGMQQGQEMSQKRAEYGLRQQELGLKVRKQEFEEGVYRKEEARKDEAYYKQQQISGVISKSLQEGDIDTAIKSVGEIDGQAALNLMEWKGKYNESISKAANNNADTATKAFQVKKDSMKMLGDMSYAILNERDPENQAVMFDKQKQLASSLGIDFPFADTWGKEAALQQQLIMAHALPATEMFKSKQEMMQAKSDVGKILQDKRSALEAGDTNGANLLDASAKAKYGEIAQSAANLLQTKLDGVYNKEDTLRKEFNGLTADFREKQDAFNRLDKLVQGGDEKAGTVGAGAYDTALIFNFMLSIGAGPVIRENEFNLAESIGGLPAKFQIAASKVLQGERLTPETRQAMLMAGQDSYMASKEGYDQTAKSYKDIAITRGINIDSAVPDYKLTRHKAANEQIQEISNMNADALSRHVKDNPQILQWAEQAKSILQKQGKNVPTETLIKKKMIMDLKQQKGVNK